MNNITISEEKLKEFRTKLSDYYLYEVFSNDFEVADKIRRMKELQDDPERIKQFDEINARMKAAKEEMESLTKQAGSVKKYGDKKAMLLKADKAQGEIQKCKLEKSRLVKPLETLYQEISHYADKAEQSRTSYEFATKFEFGTEVEQLPFAIIDGTKYKMKNNILEKTSLGQMVLFIENNENDTNGSSTGGRPEGSVDADAPKDSEEA